MWMGIRIFLPTWRRKRETVAAQELAEEGASLLRKAKEEKEASQAEARRLAEENAVMVAKKEQTEEEVVRLRQELQDPQTRFDSLYFFTMAG